MRTKRGGIDSSRWGSQKGQVAVFIIVGIVLLFTFAGILYTTQVVNKESISAAGEPIITDAPLEFLPIQQYTENCLTQIGKRGLVILGQQGGYIYPELLGEFSVSAPTDSMGINLEPMKVPYWHYNQEPNAARKVLYSSWKPMLYAAEDAEMSVETQLSRFVREQLDSCLREYEVFTEQGFTMLVDPAKEVEVRVGEEAVGFYLTLEVAAQIGEAKHQFDQFYVKIPLKLKHYYEVAGEITKAQQEHKFLESQGIELINIFSGVDMNKLPPTSATDFEAAPTVFWNEIDVQKDLKRILASYVPMLRFLGSRSFYRYEYPVTDLSGLYQRTYDNMIIPLEGADDLVINFDYLNWEPYLDLNADGGAVKPFQYTMSFWMLHFAMQEYYNSYDVSYPVLVSLVDSASFNGEGYTFAFALESNVRNNRPPEHEEVFPAPKVLTRSMVCDENKRNTELIKTIVVDSATKEPLEAVRLGFSIPEQDECFMGFSDAEGEVETSYPAVYGGVLDLTKDGYLTNYYPLDTYAVKDQPLLLGYAITDYPQEKVIEMHPQKTLSVKVKKKNLEKCIERQCFFGGLFGSSSQAVFSYTPELTDKTHRWVLMSGNKELTEDEVAAFTLKRAGDIHPGLFSEEFWTGVNLRGRQEAEVLLYPGVYEVTAYLFSEEEMIIPKDERCAGGILGGCVPIEEMRMEKFSAGSLNWNTEKTYLRITPEQLYGSQELTLYVLNQDLKSVPAESGMRVVEDLQMMGEMDRISKLPEVRAALAPKFN